RPDYCVVRQLISFQLESISRPRLRIGVVLNVTPDHLDRHKSFERYVELKARAVAFLEPDDYAVLNLDDPACAAMRSETRGQVIEFGLQQPVRSGVTVTDGWITIAGPAQPGWVMRTAEDYLTGENNMSKVLTAIRV